MAVQEITQNKELYQDFLVDDTMDEFLTKLSQNGTWAGNVAAYALANKLNIAIKIYELKTELVIITITPKDSSISAEDAQSIELAYLSQCHYDAIISNKPRTLNQQQIYGERSQIFWRTMLHAVSGFFAKEFSHKNVNVRNVAVKYVWSLPQKRILLDIIIAENVTDEDFHILLH